MVDNRLTPGLKSYCGQARAFREQEMMRVHARNLARSEARGRDQHKKHDVDRRWNENPALLKDRLGRPASAVGLAPQTHTRALVRADAKVRPRSGLAKRLGGSEDLVFELGGSPTPLARLRPPTGPPSALARAEHLDLLRDSGAPVRHGYTHRERAVLWGTSLANYQSLQDVTDVELDSASCLRRRRRRRCAGATGDEPEHDFQYAKKVQVRPEERANVCPHPARTPLPTLPRVALRASGRRAGHVPRPACEKTHLDHLPSSPFCDRTTCMRSLVRPRHTHALRLPATLHCRNPRTPSVHPQPHLTRIRFSFLRWTLQTHKGAGARPPP